MDPVIVIPSARNVVHSTVSVYTHLVRTFVTNLVVRNWLGFQVHCLIYLHRRRHLPLHQSLHRSLGVLGAVRKRMLHRDVIPSVANAVIPRVSALTAVASNVATLQVVDCPSPSRRAINCNSNISSL